MRQVTILLGLAVLCALGSLAGLVIGGIASVGRVHGAQTYPYHHCEEHREPWQPSRCPCNAQAYDFCENALADAGTPLIAIFGCQADPNLTCNWQPYGWPCGSSGGNYWNCNPCCCRGGSLSNGCNPGGGPCVISRCTDTGKSAPDCASAFRPKCS